MRLLINGEVQEMPNGISLGELLQHLRLSHSGVVVERNGDIVPREELPTLPLTEGDRLEIVRLVGGG